MNHGSTLNPFPLANSQNVIRPCSCTLGHSGAPFNNYDIQKKHSGHDSDYIVHLDQRNVIDAFIQNIKFPVFKLYVYSIHILKKHAFREEFVIHLCDFLLHFALEIFSDSHNEDDDRG